MSESTSIIRAYSEYVTLSLNERNAKLLCLNEDLHFLIVLPVLIRYCSQIKITEKK
jgi:hypothetical protein